MTNRDRRKVAPTKGSWTDVGSEKRVNQKVLYAAVDVLMDDPDGAATSSCIYEALAKELKDLVEQMRITEQLSGRPEEESKFVVDVKKSSTKSSSKRKGPSATDHKNGAQQKGSEKSQRHPSKQDTPQNIEKGTTVNRDICLQPLSSEERKTVESLTYNVSLERRVIYVKEANIYLKARDLCTLQGQNWLNDEIINTFAALINARSLFYRNRLGTNDTGTHVPDVTQSSPTDGVEIFQLARPRVHAFNSFFWVSLTQSQSGFNYRRVRRWLKTAFSREPFTRYDLFLFPINKGNSHWVLSVIDLRGKKFFYFDSLHEPDDLEIVRNLRRWLKEAIGDTMGSTAVAEMDIDSWTSVNNPSYTPKQSDSSACGIFILYLAYYLELGKRPEFSQNDVGTLRERTALFLNQGKLPDI